MPSDTRLEKVLDSAEARPPTASPVADPSWSVAEAPLPMSTPCDASHELTVSRPFVTSALIWPDCCRTPETTSQIEPTTIAVRPSSTSSAPAERGTPRAPIRSTSGANRAPSTTAMTSGTTKPATCESSHSTAKTKAMTPTSSHERSPTRTSPGEPATAHPLGCASGMATNLLLGATVRAPLDVRHRRAGDPAKPPPREPVDGRLERWSSSTRSEPGGRSTSRASSSTSAPSCCACGTASSSSRRTPRVPTHRPSSCGAPTRAGSRSTVAPSRATTTSCPAWCPAA